MEQLESQILAVYRDTVGPLFRYVARNACGDSALAEDVTQEAWLRAVREWRRKGLPDEPLAWLTTVARNLLASYYRRRRPIALDAVSAEDVLAAFDSGRAAESAELTAVVCRALARLPLRHAELLEAFHFDRRRMSHIARASGISERAVEGRLRRARERLRRELESMLKIRGDNRWTLR